MSETRFFKCGSSVIRVNADGTEDALHKTGGDGIAFSTFNSASEDRIQAGDWVPCTEAEAMDHIGRAKPEPAPAPVPNLRPFWIVWSLDLQKSDDYTHLRDAETEARRRAEEAPGEEHFVMQAVRVFKAEKPVAVGRQIGGAQ